MRYVSVFCALLFVFSLSFASELHVAIEQDKCSTLESLLSQNPQLLEQPNEQGEPPLFYAASKGKTACVQQLIGKGADIKGKNRDGMYPILIAAQNGYLPIVKLLVQSGADLKVVDDINRAGALHWASAGGDTEVMDYVLAQGFDKEARDQLGLTPLMRAASTGQKAAFDYLLSKGTVLEVGKDLTNGLMLQAASGGNIEILEFLLDKGFNINARSPGQSYPLHGAVWRRHPEMLTYLIQHGANVAGVKNRFNYHPIHTAAFNGDTTCMSILLAHGATVEDTIEGHGLRPLHIAVQANNPVMVKYLIAHGAKVNSYGYEGFTPMAMAIQSGQLEMVKMLLDYGSTFNCPEGKDASCPQNAITPLNQAFRHPQILEYLLSKGGDPNSIDKSWNNTPLLVAAVNGDSLRSLEMILNAGAKPDLKNSKGKTALYEACMAGKLPYVELLLKKGANPNLADQTGKTPLHIAAREGHTAIVERLLAAKVDVNAKDQENKTPLYYAQYYGNQKVADALKAKKASGEAKAIRSEKELLAMSLKDKEAVIWHLGHSGWAIKTKNHLMIFDYFPPSNPSEDPSFMNGQVRAQELKDMNVTVFASHEHQDHFNPEILEWKKNAAGINYVLGFRPENQPEMGPLMGTFPPYTLCVPGSPLQKDGIEVQAIKSNIDNGSGFLVRVDGLTFFHPGDAVDTSRASANGYTHMIDSLAAMQSSMDFVFFPIRGCGFPDLEAVKLGNDYAVSHFKPAVAFPMHSLNAEEELANYVRDAEQRKALANYVCVKHRGDRFLYQNGKIEVL